MALTIASAGAGLDFVNGNKRVKYRTVTFDSSYATGGESLTAADVGLKKITHVEGSVAKPTGGTLAFAVAYDYTNSKLLAYTAAGSPGSGTALAEAASTTNLSTYVVRLRIEGF